MTAIVRYLLDLCGYHSNAVHSLRQLGTSHLYIAGFSAPRGGKSSDTKERTALPKAKKAVSAEAL
jgi:hypothetical protein